MANDNHGQQQHRPDEQQRRPDEQVRQGPSMQPQSAGAKVTVYCNLPHGLRIHADRMVAGTEPIMGGGRRDIMVAERGESVLCNGIATPRSMDGEVQTRHRIVMGYAVTEGVSKDLWDAWLAVNRKSPVVLNHCIFASEKSGYGDGEAKEHRNAVTGLEPFKQEGDPRRPRPRANMSDVGPDDKKDVA